MNKYKKTIKCLYDAAVNTIEHDGIEHAGYMAFLSIVSLFPFMVFIVALTGAIGETAIGTKFIHFIQESLPKNISYALEPRIHEIISGPPEGLLTLAIFGAIWTASSSVEGLRTILNRVYLDTTPPPYILRRLLSIFQFLLLTVIIIIATLILILVPIIYEKIFGLNFFDNQFFILRDFLTNLAPAWYYIRYFLLEIILFFVVCTIYFIVPNTKLKLNSVMAGAFIVVVLWSIAGSLLSNYLKNFKQVNFIYGSLGGIIASLIFFYIMNMILIYGAEFNYLFDKHVLKEKA
ncbi:MAG: YihY/virulence factor BrkB family protein [Alphaproteobacteria bacterium]